MKNILLFKITHFLFAGLMLFITSTGLAQIKADQEKGCAPLVVNFSLADTDLSKVAWQFGNGQSSNAANPSIIFDQAGAYSVSAIITRNSGQVDTLTVNDFIKVSESPTANFELNNSSACVGAEINFTNLSSAATQYLWTFGDGNQSTEENPVYHFNEAGTYAVSLTAINADNCQSMFTLEEEIIIQEPLSISIQADGTIQCLNDDQSINFSFDQSVQSASWNFGDGNTTEDKNVSHQYSASGKYKVKVNYVDANNCSGSLVLDQEISVIEILKPKIIANKQRICLGQSVKFTAEHAATAGFLWEIDKQQYEGKQIEVAFPNAGNFNVTLSYTDSAACTIETIEQDFISVEDVPSPQIDFHISRGCAPFIFEATNITEKAVKFSWKIKNEIIEGKALSYKFQEPGTYKIFAITTYESGCEIMTELDPIDVFSSETKIETSPISGCEPFETSFDLSNKNATQIRWNSGDGQSSAEAQFNLTNQNAGEYFPSVSYINEHGCELNYAFEIPIVVYENDIKLNEPEIIESCTYTDVYFSGEMGYGSWTWDFGDGTISTDQNPNHSYSEPGTYYVNLTTQNKNGCETTISPYNIIEIPDLDAETTLKITKGDECGYFSVEIDAELKEGQTAQWIYGESIVGNGSSVKLSFITLESLSILLRLRGEGDCSKSKAILIPNPWADCENPELEDAEESEEYSPIGRYEFTSCTVPFNLNLINPTPDAKKFEWRFEDGTVGYEEKFTKTYTQPGVYTIDFQARFSADSVLLVEDFVTVTVENTIIDFDFKLEKICEGYRVDFFPINPDYSDYKWKINNKTFAFGGGGTHIFPEEGLYSVSLTASGQNQCEATRIKNIFIGNQENQFTYQEEYCLGDVTQVSHSLMGFATIEWDLGNGDSVAGNKLNYTYAVAGSYQITAIGTDFEGCKTEFSFPTTIEVKNPIAAFKANKNYGCGELTVQFTNLSAGVSQWLWDFGNGTTSTAQNPKVKFTPGNYTVTLQAINGGCVDLIEQIDFIQVDELVSSFSYTYDQNCLPLTVQFTDESINASEWYWDFGDGVTSILQNPRHTYDQMPQTEVSLTVKNYTACVNVSKQKMDFIFHAGFTVDNREICLGSSVQFTADNATAIAWQWDFGDGTHTSQQNPMHKYQVSGHYTVQLIVENESDCSDTVRMENYIEVVPFKADFELAETIASNCVPVQVSFKNNAKGAVSYFWIFGDGKTSKAANPAHVYQKVGEFDVKLIITNKLGCTDTLTKVKLVKISGPQTKFEVNEEIICLPNTAKFTDLSAEAVEWRWFFGDGNTSDQQNPEHQYDQPGHYKVTLIAKNADGCEQNFSIDSLRVLPTPQLEFEMQVSGECYPVSVTLINKSENLLNPEFVWDFGNGTSSSEESPSLNYTQIGNFEVSLTITNDGGCAVTFTHPDKVLIRDTIHTTEAKISQVLVEKNRVKFDFESYPYNNIAHYNVYRDSPTGFRFMQTINAEGGFNQRVQYEDNSCRPQDMSHEYIFQAVSYCEDTVSIENLSVYNTLHLTTATAQELRTVKWNAHKGRAIDNFRIFRKEQMESNWQEIAVLEAATLNFEDQSDVCPGIYAYRVGAFDQNQLRSISNYVDFEVTETIYVDQIAEIKNTTVMESGEVFMEWSVPEAGKGRITAYEIYRSENGSDFTYFDSVEPQEQFYIDAASDTENNTYNYQVKVLNDCAIDSESSKESNTVLLQKDVKFRKYELKWNAFEGWDKGVKKYIIQRLNENGEWETVEEVSGDQLKTIVKDTKN